jgi:membrane protease YdiL (CAAX protease family)
MVAAWITGETRHLSPLALAERWPALIAHLCLQVALIGCLEELGWRGWLLKHLLKYQSRTLATASVAAVWYVWHLPLILSGAKVAVAIGLAAIALSILFTELFVRTQSVLLVALAHGSANAPHFFLADVVALKDPADVLLVSGFIYLVPAAMVVASWRRASLQRTP